MQAQTPLWMQEKLRRGGIRSIDPVVDITNFVMLELGQPMHAFDAACIQGDINVRYAKKDERLVLLDEREVTLSKDTLVIADDQQALAMAGVFGGLASGVTAKTKDIFLECAYFNPDLLRGQARQYGLHTDSSHRFERGVDSQLQTQAIERAITLIHEICGGDIGPLHHASSASHLPSMQRVRLRQTRLDQVLGHAIAAERVTQILESLGFEVEHQQEDEASSTWQVAVPSFRFDIKIEEDLIEEVARVYGYNNIPHCAPTAALNMRQHQESTIGLTQVRQTLVTRGFHEAITYSFVDPKRQALVHPQQSAMILPHPISEDMSAMRCLCLQVFRCGEL